MTRAGEVSRMIAMGWTGTARGGQTMRQCKLLCLLVVPAVLVLQRCLPAVEHAASTPAAIRSRLPATNTLTPTTGAPTTSPVPSLPANNSRQAVYEFVQANGGCELPCLFGLAAGRSTKTDVRNLMRFFASGASSEVDETDSLEVHNHLDSVTRRGSSGSSVTFWHDRIRAQLNIGYLYGSDGKIEQMVLSSESWQHSGQGRNESARILYDDRSYADLLRLYSLDRILSTFGAPREIIVHPFPDDPGHPSPPAQYPFSFVLYYPERGFLMEYSSARGEQSGFYIGCPTASHIAVSTWAPTGPLSIDEAVRYFSNLYGVNPSTVGSFRPIADVTDFDVNSFYQTFKVPTDKCIETPRQLWQNP
jgi:hypothetical protein